MPAWKFYLREAKKYEDDHRAHIPLFNKKRIQQFTKRVCEYYDVVTPEITYRGRTYHRCIWEPPRLNFIEGHITLGLFCHEIAHHVENQLNDNRRHDTRLAKRIEEVLGWLYTEVLEKRDKFGMK